MLIQIPYTVREGLASFRRARFAAFTATSAMAVALVLIGLFAILGYEAQKVSDWLRQRAGELEIFLDDVDEASAEAVYRRAALVSGVSETEYVSKQEALAIFEREFGEGSEVFVDEPFLPASIKVRVQPDYANADSLQALAAEFTTWRNVDEVVFNQALLVKVQQNLRMLTLAGVSLGILVILASLFLVANTIRLTIYARRLMIRTMKLVGATDSFVRQPFLVEGMAQGIVAAFIAGIVVWILHARINDFLTDSAGGSALTGLLFFIVLLALGALLGWAGSAFAVRRFLKNVALH